MSLLLDMICNKLRPKGEKEQEVPDTDFTSGPRPASINRLGLQCGSCDGLEDLPPINRGPRVKKQVHVPAPPTAAETTVITPPQPAAAKPLQAPAFGPALPEIMPAKSHASAARPTKKVRKRKVTYRLPDALAADVKNIAKATGKTQVRLVTEALHGYVAYQAKILGRKMSPAPACKIRPPAQS